MDINEINASGTWERVSKDKLYPVLEQYADTEWESLNIHVINASGTWVRIYKRDSDALLKKHANAEWKSLRVQNETGAYGYTEYFTANDEPILKIEIDSARQWGKVYKYVPNPQKYVIKVSDAEGNGYFIERGLSMYQADAKLRSAQQEAWDRGFTTTPLVPNGNVICGFRVHEKIEKDYSLETD